MVQIKLCLLVVAMAIAIVSAQPLDPNYYNNFLDENSELESNPVVELVRERRSLQPGAPDYNPNQQKNQNGWEFKPNVNRDDRGNTNTNFEINHRGDRHDVNAGWGKVIRGPNKAKPTWHVGGSIRW